MVCPCLWIWMWCLNRIGSTINNCIAIFNKNMFSRNNSFYDSFIFKLMHITRLKDENTWQGIIDKEDNSIIYSSDNLNLNISVDILLIIKQVQFKFSMLLPRAVVTQFCLQFVNIIKDKKTTHTIPLPLPKATSTGSFTRSIFRETPGKCFLSCWDAVSAMPWAIYE